MTSLLGDLANRWKGILDNESEGTIEFYVRGYTRTIRTINVQPSHRGIWTSILKANLCNENESAIRPLENSNYIIHLVPEPENQYDSSAVLVALGLKGCSVPSLVDLDKVSHYAILGYVPKEISSVLKKHLKNLSPGWIQKVRKRGKNYVTKVAFKYSGLNVVYSQDQLLLEKFWDIVE